MDPRNLAELQSPYINIFQALTCTTYPPPPASDKAKEGRQQEGGIRAWRPFLKWQATGLKPPPRELRKKKCMFLDIKKREGTMSFQHFAKSGTILKKS